MADEINSNPIVETSPSVQTHLGILQAVIVRMASNSSSSKGWCITLVSAILVVVADKSKPDYALLALLPILLFAALDAYYLGIEKGFRNSYNDFVQKLHSGGIKSADLFSVQPMGAPTKLQLEALQSFSIWGFYLVLTTLVLLAKTFVL